MTAPDALRHPPREPDHRLHDLRLRELLIIMTHRVGIDALGNPKSGQPPLEPTALVAGHEQQRERQREDRRGRQDRDHNSQRRLTGVDGEHHPGSGHKLSGVHRFVAARRSNVSAANSDVSSAMP